MNIELNLLDNGLDFIIKGLEPAWRPSLKDEQSLWKYSVLNCYSGIELILKEKLRREHWSLIFEDLGSANNNKLTQGDFISISHSEVIKRLKGICEISINDEPINNLRKVRNRFEHFEVKITIIECKKIIAEALKVLIDFLNKHLNLDECCPSSDETGILG